MAVAQLAMRDRRFFEHLLSDPREAMDVMVRRGKVRLTEADKRRVVRLINEGKRAVPEADALAQWDRFQQQGVWGGGWKILDWFGARP